MTVCVVKGMNGVHGGGEDALTAWGEVSSGIVGFCGAFNLFCFVFCVLCSVFSSRGPIVGMAALCLRLLVVLSSCCYVKVLFCLE